ncbi:MAG: hypothetical protein HC897_20330 [Thermoanaerobaculia bacterium]|nr:hypothetical protein [Thermoanaerobaculia bacterium]
MRRLLVILLAFSLGALSRRSLGMSVWPKGLAETFTVDITRCRFKVPDGATEAVHNADILDLLGKINEEGLEFVKTEQLYLFDGQPGFQRGQGQ